MAFVDHVLKATSKAADAGIRGSQAVQQQTEQKRQQQLKRTESGLPRVNTVPSQPRWSASPERIPFDQKAYRKWKRREARKKKHTRRLGVLPYIGEVIGGALVVAGVIIGGIGAASVTAGLGLIGGAIVGGVLTWLLSKAAPYLLLLILCVAPFLATADGGSSWPVGFFVFVILAVLGTIPIVDYEKP